MFPLQLAAHVKIGLHAYYSEELFCILRQCIYIYIYISPQFVAQTIILNTIVQGFTVVQFFDLNNLLYV